MSQNKSDQPPAEDVNTDEAPSNSSKLSAINFVFVAFVLSAVLCGGLTGKMKEVTDASFEQAKASVSLAISLIGIMGLWLGFMRVLEAGGAMKSIARVLKPVMSRLFKDVPPEHPAMSAMILNISANVLGLGNAATPFGIRAMQELNKLNPIPGTATNAMCLFLAINTSSVTLLPLGVIGVRAAAGSTIPTAIMLPTLLATVTSTAIAIIAAKLLEGRSAVAAPSGMKLTQTSQSDSQNTAANDAMPQIETYEHLRIAPSKTARRLAQAFWAMFFGVLFYRIVAAEDCLGFISSEFLSYWLMPFLMFGILLYGMSKGVKIYEAVTEGAKQGFEVAVRIIPFLVAILVAIGVFRASGAFDFIISFIRPVTDYFGIPADTLPMALIRPLSGSGAFAVMSDVIKTAPDSYSSYVVSTLMGCTETTFYVLAVYFGAIGVTRIRHAVLAAVLADIAGIVSAYAYCALLWQPPA